MRTRDILAWQHCRATNDVNGNPRRCYVVYDRRGNIADVIDEGYQGLPAQLRAVVQLASVNITPSDYRALVRDHGTGWVKR